MPHENLSYEDLLRIVQLIKSSEQFSEFRLKVGDVEIELRRRGASGPAAIAPAAPSTPAEPAPVAPAQTSRPAAAPAAHNAGEWPAGSVIIRAPMVGIFYRAPQPGAPPFVDVGQPVEPGATVCIIEVMKLMNSIPAGVRGTVLQVLVEDSAAVESGQPLIVIAPGPATP